MPEDITPTTHFGAVDSRRRARQTGDMKREHRLHPRFDPEEYQAVLANAAAARLSPTAWCARAAAAPGMAVRLRSEADARSAIVAELLSLHRQMAGAARNLNQVTAALHATSERTAELDAVVAYVARVAEKVDQAVVRLVSERRG